MAPLSEAVAKGATVLLQAPEYQREAGRFLRKLVLLLGPGREVEKELPTEAVKELV